jgi:ABC-2 type transport system permease protein
MNLRRIAILFRKDLFQGQRSFILIFGIAMPVLLSFIIAAVFGTLTSEKPELGVVKGGEDDTGTGLAARLENNLSFEYREYGSESALIEAVGDGIVDMGIVIPPDLEKAVKAGTPASVQVYTWGESQAKDRAVISSTISGLIREIAGQDLPVDIVVVLLGDEAEIPWSVRVLPILMLMAIFLGGVFIPSTSIISEKSKRPLPPSSSPCQYSKFLPRKGYSVFFSA